MPANIDVYVQCSCDIADSGVCSGEQRLSSMEPSLAVDYAAKEPPSSCFIAALAKATRYDPRYRRAHAASLFIDQILHGKPNRTDTNRPHWETALLGLSNTFASIYETLSGHVDDEKLLLLLPKYFVKITDVLWDDIDFMNTPTSVNDSTRALVANVFASFALNKMTKRLLYEPKPIKIILSCWLNMSPSQLEDLPDPLRLAVSMFTPADDNGPSPFSSSFVAVIFGGISPTVFATKLNVALKDKNVVGWSLQSELAVLLQLAAGKSSSLTQELLSARMHHQVVAAMMRQARSGDASYTARIFSDGEAIVSYLLNDAADTMKIYTDLLDKSCIMEVAAEGLKIMNRAQKEDDVCQAGDWVEFLDQVKHAIVCDNFKGCPFHSTPEFLGVARKSIELVFIPTREALQSETGVDGDRYLDFWEDFMPFLGISELSIRERYRQERKCCYINCYFRNSGIAMRKKWTCAKCQKVFYCDRECQKSDWSTHKMDCRPGPARDIPYGLLYPNLPHCPFF